MSRRKPQLSVVTISRNDEAGLTRTLESLRSISEAVSIELHVVDGGSRYDVAGVARAAFGAELASATSESDRGIGDAWNKGIRRCASPNIMLLNSGDELMGNGHNELARRLVATTDEVLVANVHVGSYSADAIRLGRSRFRYPAWLGIGFLHPGMIASNSVYEIVGAYDEQYTFASDCDWILRARRLGIRFAAGPHSVLMEANGISVKHRSAARREYEIALKNSGASMLSNGVAHLATWALSRKTAK